MPKRKYKLKNHAWRMYTDYLRINHGGCYDIYRHEVWRHGLLRKTPTTLVNSRVLVYSGYAAEQLVFNCIDPSAHWRHSMPFRAFRAFCWKGDTSIVRYRIGMGRRQPRLSDGRSLGSRADYAPGAWCWPMIDRLDARLQPVARQMKLGQFHDADDVEHIVRYEWMTPLIRSLTETSSRQTAR